ncbi:hypothetical protein [Paraburkholderia sp. J41]|uniref:hypothetical protein n=1 Tax=Paraburkholderia sp. J41 TaxID=2805433 RepID=UPI002AC32BE9|nr:hypothetical protein [Paraburkholderia sp. J41]
MPASTTLEQEESGKDERRASMRRARAVWAGLIGGPNRTGARVYGTRTGKFNIPFAEQVHANVCMILELSPEDYVRLRALACNPGVAVLRGFLPIFFADVFADAAPR